MKKFKVQKSKVKVRGSRFRMLALILVACSIQLFAQVDSTYFKSLEKDYQEFVQRYNENKKQEVQLEAILLYIEDRYKNEKQRLDSLRVK